jgi:hypothetical protein
MYESLVILDKQESEAERGAEAHDFHVAAEVHSQAGAWSGKR